MKSKTSISVVIPTHGDATFLKWTLHSVMKSASRVFGSEIIVVENGDKSETTERQVAQTAAMFSSLRTPLRYVHEATPGVLAGRHRGAREAVGETLAFIDDDVVVDEGWLESIEECLKDPTISLVGGPSRPIYLSEPPSWVSDRKKFVYKGTMLPELSLIDPGADIDDPNLDLIWSLNMTIRRQTFETARGFHPDLVPTKIWFTQGDGETGLTRKIASQGARGAFRQNVSVRHVIPGRRMTADYLQQRYRYQGICDAYAWLRYGEDRYAIRRRIPSSIAEYAKRVSSSFVGKQRRIQNAWPLPNGKDYVSGWTDLVAVVSKNPRLAEWVKQTDYLTDYGFSIDDVGDQGVALKSQGHTDIDLSAWLHRAPRRPPID